MRQDDEGGWAFIFAPVCGKGVTVCAPSLTAACAQYPELLTRRLEQVWCLRTANCIWKPIDCHGKTAKPWPMDWTDGFCEIEYDEWEEI